MPQESHKQCLDDSIVVDTSIIPSQWLIQQVDGRMIVLSDTGFHAAEGIPPTSNCVSAASGGTVYGWRRCFPG